MLAAMSSGHDGSLSTVHAGSPEEALRRVETLALMGGVDLPHAAIRDQVAGAIDLVVHQARLPDGRRRVVSVAEVDPRGRRAGHARALRGPRRPAALAAARPGPGRSARARRECCSRVWPHARRRPRDARAGAAARGGRRRLRGRRGVVGARRARARAGPGCSPRSGPAARWRAWSAPLRAGREASRAERRRLVAVGTAALLAAGWLLAGPAAGAVLAASGAAARRAAARRGPPAPARARRRGGARRGPGARRRAGRRTLGARRAGGGGARRRAGRPAAAELRLVAAQLALGESTDDRARALARARGSPCLRRPRRRDHAAARVGWRPRPAAAWTRRRARGTRARGGRRPRR